MNALCFSELYIRQKFGQLLISNRYEKLNQKVLTHLFYDLICHLIVKKRTKTTFRAFRLLVFTSPILKISRCSKRAAEHREKNWS